MPTGSAIHRPARAASGRPIGARPHRSPGCPRSTGTRHERRAVAAGRHHAARTDRRTAAHARAQGEPDRSAAEDVDDRDSTSMARHARADARPSRFDRRSRPWRQSRNGAALLGREPSANRAGPPPSLPRSAAGRPNRSSGRAASSCTREQEKRRYAKLETSGPRPTGGQERILAPRPRADGPRGRKSGRAWSRASSEPPSAACLAAVALARADAIERVAQAHRTTRAGGRDERAENPIGAWRRTQGLRPSASGVGAAIGPGCRDVLGRGPTALGVGIETTPDTGSLWRWPRAIRPRPTMSRSVTGLE